MVEALTFVRDLLRSLPGGAVSQLYAIFVSAMSLLTVGGYAAGGVPPSGTAAAAAQRFGLDIDTATGTLHSWFVDDPRRALLLTVLFVGVATCLSLAAMTMVPRAHRHAEHIRAYVRPELRDAYVSAVYTDAVGRIRMCACNTVLLLCLVVEIHGLPDATVLVIAGAVLFALRLLAEVASSGGRPVLPACFDGIRHYLSALAVVPLEAALLILRALSGGLRRPPTIAREDLLLPTGALDPAAIPAGGPLSTPR